jgi:diguanylate cyclase (GGDEF)-like protein
LYSAYAMFKRKSKQTRLHGKQLAHAYRAAVARQRASGQRTESRPAREWWRLLLRAVAWLSAAIACSSFVAALWPLRWWTALLATLPPASALLFTLAARRNTPGGTLLAERTVETVEQHLELVEDENRRLRAAYREAATTARDKQTAYDDMAVGLKLLATSTEEGDNGELNGRILRAIMEVFDAGGAALWLADYRGDRLEVQATAGRVAPILAHQPVLIAGTTLPSDARRACEERLRLASPIRESVDGTGHAGPSDLITGPADLGPDILAVALRLGEKLYGVVALSGPREARFPVGDTARLAALAPTVALAVQNVERRVSLQRSVREVTLLHEMGGLVQSAMAEEALYNAVVDMVGKVVPYENCTVFVYDGTERKLLPRATRGRVVNLIDHIPFEHGSGISGWVAQKRKQLFVTDLTREPGLLNVELIPPRVRSFVSVPMVVQDSVIGVLNVSHSKPNAFSPDDVRVLSTLASQAAITIDRRDMLRSLEHMAITDGLTRIYNHRYFQMRLSNELKRAQRYSLPLSLLMLDIDHFKAINDRYGHAAGDMILAEVARLVVQALRETDIVARYGGEELSVILTQTSLLDAERTAERLRRTIAEHAFSTPDGVPLAVSVSVGVAAFPDHAAERDSLLRKADTALYSAKQAGRNAVRTAVPTHDIQAVVSQSVTIPAVRP